jgi:hypothetical protein
MPRQAAPGQVTHRQESKCPFAAILKAVGQDIAGMSMPANHKAAHGVHNHGPTGSLLASSSGLSKEIQPWRREEVSKRRTFRDGLMSELCDKLNHLGNLVLEINYKIYHLILVLESNYKIYR